MNYRHAFHAGNFADVVKHVVLVGLLKALQRKPGAFCYVDSHAGRGRYDLGGDEARRTGEFAGGIERVLAADRLPPLLQAYADCVRSANPVADALRAYPGSPSIAAMLMREQDRAILCELHAEEVAALRAALRGDRRFAIHHRDGYAALDALLPPAQKRGLVLIDPPFEAQAAEFETLQAAIANGLRRWPNATFAVWYPIKLRAAVLPFRRWLGRAAAAGGALDIELMLGAESPLRLAGCGLALLNPPWRFEAQLEPELPALHRLLADGASGSVRLHAIGPG